MLLVYRVEYFFFLFFLFHSIFCIFCQTLKKTRFVQSRSKKKQRGGLLKKNKFRSSLGKKKLSTECTISKQKKAFVDVKKGGGTMQRKFRKKKFFFVFVFLLFFPTTPRSSLIFSISRVKKKQSVSQSVSQCSKCLFFIKKTGILQNFPTNL